MDRGFANRDFLHLPPCGVIAAHSDWRTWLIMAGRGFGKTRAGAEWVLTADWRARSRCRIALVAATLDEARRVMVEGTVGPVALAPTTESTNGPQRSARCGSKMAGR